jgi:hypothetical protein
VKHAVKMYALMSLASLGLGLSMTACKSAPPLTDDQAKAMIQAKYDTDAATGASITIDNAGMVQGATAKYWTRTKVYPNRYWADFTLTADGKKAVKLSDGTDTIKWRPESPTDQNFSVVVLTNTANHPKVRDIRDMTDAVGGGKTASYTLDVDLTGVPDALQGIAHNKGNRLSSTHQADFVLDNGNWKLQSIE